MDFVDGHGVGKSLSLLGFVDGHGVGKAVNYTVRHTGCIASCVYFHDTQIFSLGWRGCQPE